jgi:hypothetical protein
MTANVMENNKVVTVGDPAWHSLGQNFKEPISAEGAHDAMGGSFEIKTLPAGVMFDGVNFTKLPKKFAIVRGPTKDDPNPFVFDFISDHYHVVQPIQIIKAFDQRVGVSISSLGFIGNGEKMFLCWNMPKLEIAEGDDVQLYGSVLFGFDSIFSCRLNISTVRIVCENTWVANLMEADSENSRNRGRGTIYSGKHTNPNLINELAAWMGHIQANAEKESGLVNGFFKKLVRNHILNENQAKELIYTAFPDPKPLGDVPEELREKKQKAIDNDAEKAEAIRVGIWDVFSTDRGIKIDQNNYWGLFNACTQYFNHEQGSKKDTAFSIVWGNRNSQMNEFAKVLQRDIYG